LKKSEELLETLTQLVQTIEKTEELRIENAHIKLQPYYLLSESLIECTKIISVTLIVISLIFTLFN